MNPAVDIQFRSIVHTHQQI